MPKVVKPPTGKEGKCGECGAVLQYMPQEVEKYSGTDYSGGPDGYERVKCPCCPGYAYIKSW